MSRRFSVESIFKMVDRVTAPVSRMQNRVGKFTRSMSRGLQAANRAVNVTARGFKNFAMGVAKYGGIALGVIGTGIGLLIRQFSKVEDAQAAFTPLLGSAEKARQAVEAINETAATTPFQFEQLAGSVNQLLPVMNGNIDQTIKTVRMLGDTAGGNAQKLDSITRGFTKAMLKGKVDMESLNMIAEAGVPIFTELADSMGTKVGPAFFKMISAGKVTTQQLNEAFQKMTGEGGKFFRGMEIASETVSGRWSTLKDNIALTAAELGGILAPTIKDLITKATKIAQQVREWVKANRELINRKFLEYLDLAKKGFFALVDAFNWLRKHGDTVLKVVATITALIVVLKILTAVMAVVNIVMMANPIGLIVLGIAALIAAIAAAIIWWDEIKAAFLSLPGPVKAALAVITGPIGWIIGAALLIKENWEPIKDFFANLWQGIVGIFQRQIDRIMGLVDKVKAGVLSVAEFFGFGDDEDQGPITRSRGRNRGTVSPHDRTARMVEERRQTSTAEVTIKDETGRAKVTRGRMGRGVRLQPTGAF